MKFIHDHTKVGYSDLQSQTGEDGFRYYTTPNGVRMPSITSVLSGYKQHVIDEWVARVGEEEAEKIKHAAGWRGTLVHEALEDYMNGIDPKDIIHLNNPLILHGFNQIKASLDQHLTKVYGMEVPLYSDLLNTAGRVDLVCEYDGKLTILDFKTSLKSKMKEWIDSYFMQAAFYGLAWGERTGNMPEQIVIVMANDKGHPQVFVEPIGPWVYKMSKYVMNWHKENMP